MTGAKSIVNLPDAIDVKDESLPLMRAAYSEKMSIADWIQANRKNFKEISAGWDGDCETAVRISQVLSSRITGVARDWSSVCNNFAAEVRELFPPKAMLENGQILVDTELQKAFAEKLTAIKVPVH